MVRYFDIFVFFDIVNICSSCMACIDYMVIRLHHLSEQDCSNDEDCLNGGRCLVGKCECTSGFAGKNCEKGKDVIALSTTTIGNILSTTQILYVSTCHIYFRY